MEINNQCSNCAGNLKRDRAIAYRYAETFDPELGTIRQRLMALRCKDCQGRAYRVYCLHESENESGWVQHSTIDGSSFYAARDTTVIQGRVGSTASEWSKRMSRGIQ